MEISNQPESRFPYLSTSPITHFQQEQDQALVSEAQQQLLLRNSSFSDAAWQSQGDGKENKESSAQDRKPLWGGRKGWGKTENSTLSVACNFVTP